MQKTKGNPKEEQCVPGCHKFLSRLNGEKKVIAYRIFSLVLSSPDWQGSVCNLAANKSTFPLGIVRQIKDIKTTWERKRLKSKRKKS
jgi:hypothetical protein